MRNMCIALWMLLCPMTLAHAQISIHIGINVPVYPELVVVPGYPVYYAPRAEWNYFFYDGVYWVYQEDNWYASSWYNGPWELVRPEYVPLFVLRIPVRYYRQPPVYFRGWSPEAPPRWGEHWGRDWEQHRSGWDKWDRRSAPPPAPLPVYQQKYSGDRYPQAVEQQHAIRSQNYSYQPREAVTQQHYQQRGSPAAEPQHQAPAQQTKPSQPMQQGQPVQAAPETKQPQPASQGKGQEKKAASQDVGPERKAAPQDKGPEKKAAPQGKGPEKKDASQQDMGGENKKEEHGKGPR